MIPLLYRKEQPATRVCTRRNVKKLIVIATEGEATESEYFTGLFLNRTSSAKLQIEILETKRGFSAPRYVIQRLNEIKLDSELKKQDQLWIVIDVDSWTNAEIEAVITECNKKSYHVAISNPCFEIWLLLHLLPYNVLRNRSSLFQKRLVEKLGICENSHITSFQSLRSGMRNAITNAALLRGNSTDDIPPAPGTDVYRLVDEILSSM